MRHYLSTEILVFFTNNCDFYIVHYTRVRTDNLVGLITIYSR